MCAYGPAKILDLNFRNLLSMLMYLKNLGFMIDKLIANKKILYFQNLLGLLYPLV